MVEAAAQPAGPPRAGAGGELGLEQQLRMLRSLRQGLAQRLGRPVMQHETHISFVLVCDDHAYKIKKALRTAFLDQSTLALRRRACDEELRLNRRLAPDLYLGVVPITGRPGHAVLDGAGPVIDMAVKMLAFAQQGLWDALAAQRQLRAAHIDELAQVLVPFHAAAAVADAHGSLGSPAQVRAPLLQSLDELGGLVATVAERDIVDRLRVWEAAAFQRLRPVLAERLAQGRVRECHGDLHLGNVTTMAGRATVFDGIEFNDDFRWIDVMSEVAFMAMDLHAHGLSPLAHRFVNGVLELGGDYEGVRVLNYYLVHRALVRAKVMLLRALQCADATAAGLSDAGEAPRQRTAAHGYLELALRFAGPAEGRTAPLLMLTHGYSGSGKTTLTQELLETTGAIRIRADVERKRLAGLKPLQRGAAPALYGAAMTAATYKRLGRLAAAVLQAGYLAILDATFLRRAQRDAARRVAAEQGAATLLLHFDAAADVLRRRVHDRAACGTDASDADVKVLAAQMRTAEPLQADEAVFVCRAADAPAGAEPRVDWAPLLQRLSRQFGLAACLDPDGGGAGPSPALGSLSRPAPPRR